MSSDSRWTGGAANRQWQSGTRPREEWASEEAPPKTGFQSSVFQPSVNQPSVNQSL